jgi:hypothetical protein
VDVSTFRVIEDRVLSRIEKLEERSMKKQNGVMVLYTETCVSANMIMW